MRLIALFLLVIVPGACSGVETGRVIHGTGSFAPVAAALNNMLGPSPIISAHDLAAPGSTCTLDRRLRVVEGNRREVLDYRGRVRVIDPRRFTSREVERCNR